MRTWLFMAAALLAGCGMLGGRAEPTPREPEDVQLAQARRVAMLAFEQGRYGQAAQLYRLAIARAEARDDITAIADLRYDLAVTELRLGDPEAALVAARAARSELERRRATVFPEMHLAEATALYRLGRFQEAEPIALAVANGTGDAAPRARFLLGMIAADQRDAMRLSAILASLGDPARAALHADRRELIGRLAVLRGEHGPARLEFERASELRRDDLDYPGMARVLGAAGAAAETEGLAAIAADFFLRAGRSAHLSGGAARRDIERWLAAAERAARNAGRPDILAAIEELRRQPPPS